MALLSLTMQKPRRDCFCGLRIVSLESGEQPRVLLVASGSIAEQAGLREGDTLASACGKPIGSNEEACDLLRNAQGAVELRIRRDPSYRKSTSDIISSVFGGLSPWMEAVSGRALASMCSAPCLAPRRKSQVHLTADV